MKYILIKKPEKLKKTQGFQMYWDIRENGNRTVEKINNHELDSINLNYKSGILDFNQALAHVHELKIKLLPKKIEKNFNKSNQALVERLYNEGSGKKRKENSLKANKLDYNRLLHILGNDSVVTIEKEEFQRRIHSLALSPYTQNRLIIFANKMLKGAGRNEKIEKISDVRFETHYITEDELEILLPQLSEIDQKITRIFFYSGLRLGELFGIQHPKNYWDSKNAILYLKMQLKDIDDKKIGFKYEPLKRSSDRTIKIYPSIKEDFEYFRKLDFDFLKTYKNKFSKHLLKISRKVFSNPIKHISAHDLRHSFAMNLQAKGVEISAIAKILGNSVEVCQRHYTAGQASLEFHKRVENQIFK